MVALMQTALLNGTQAMQDGYKQRCPDLYTIITSLTAGTLDTHAASAALDKAFGPRIWATRASVADYRTFLRHQFGDCAAASKLVKTPLPQALTATDTDHVQRHRAHLRHEGRPLLALEQTLPHLQNDHRQRGNDRGESI